MSFVKKAGDRLDEGGKSDADCRSGTPHSEMDGGPIRKLKVIGLHSTLVPAARATSRALSLFESRLGSLSNSRLWNLPERLVRRDGAAFTRSVYGPLLATDWSDADFRRWASGRGGFRLADILGKKREEEFVFLDVGADLGLHSLLAFANDQCAEVYALQPDPAVFRVLQDNIARNGAVGVSLLNFGISDGNGSEARRQTDRRDHRSNLQGRDSSFFDELYQRHPNRPVFLRIGGNQDLVATLRQLAKSPLRYSVDEAYVDMNPERCSDDDVGFVVSALTEMGLKEVWRSSRQGEHDVYLRRPALYKLVEAERVRLGTWEGGTKGAPRYSVCVCNYNMADTLERAMTSVLQQLDDRFEVLVIDDGSNDGSLSVLKMLADRYPHFRYLSLPRDRNRQLGETRNISIRAARGEYVMLGIDADDVWEPFLCDFVTLYHKIETAVGHDFHLNGQQTGMAKRQLLLSFGPYRNIYRSEDRDMLVRFAERGRVLFLDYKVHRTRLARPPARKFTKAIWDSWSQMSVDMRSPGGGSALLIRSFVAPFAGSPHAASMRIRLFRAAIALPAFFLSLFHEKFSSNFTWHEMLDYQEKNRGTYAEIMARYGGNPDISFLGAKAREIFSYKVRRPGFRSS